MPKATCSVEGCEREARTRGWCHTHYQRWRNRGTIQDYPFPSVEERFWAKVEKTDHCWLWTGNVRPNGYGRFSINNRSVSVHRFVYELLIGPIPEGLVIDHQCMVRHCVNPKHLEAVTQRVNTIRGEGRWSNARRMLAKTHCPYGHPYDDANTYVQPKTGRRYCRACWKRRYWRKKALAS